MEGADVIKWPRTIIIMARPLTIAPVFIHKFYIRAVESVLFVIALHPIVHMYIVESFNI